MAKMKEVTTTVGTIDFGDWKITATGILGEREWRIETSHGKDYNDNEDFIDDEEELEELLWKNVLMLEKKYSSVVFDHTIEEVEDEDYEEDEE